MHAKGEDKNSKKPAQRNLNERVKELFPEDWRKHLESRDIAGLRSSLPDEEFTPEHKTNVQTMIRNIIRTQKYNTWLSQVLVNFDNDGQMIRHSRDTQNVLATAQRQFEDALKEPDLSKDFFCTEVGLKRGPDGEIESFYLVKDPDRTNTLKREKVILNTIGTVKFQLDLYCEMLRNPLDDETDRARYKRNAFPPKARIFKPGSSDRSAGMGTTNSQD